MPVITFNGGGTGHTANKGSSANLENYKEHEKELRIQQGRTSSEDAKCEIFGENGSMSAEESTRFIDNHRKGLKKDESKFYEFEINLSAGEQEAMFQGCPTEIQKEKVFQDYIRDVVIEQYAQNFKGYSNKDGHSIDFHKSDICWTAAIHTERFGEEAKKWKQQHPDMNREDWHAHITVAHRTMDQLRSISPKKNQRTNNSGSCQGYFDRNNFRESIEQSMDLHFGYDRPIEDSLKFRQNNRHLKKENAEALLNDVDCQQSKQKGYMAAMKTIAEVKRRKHMEAEDLKARLEAERNAAAEERTRQKAAAEAGEKNKPEETKTTDQKNIQKPKKGKGFKM